MTTKNKTTKAGSAKTETMEDTIKNATTASTEAMQDGFEQAVLAAGEFGEHVKANSEAVVESFTIAGQGMEAINTEITASMKTSYENGVATAQAMASAKSLQEMVELQADYAKSAMEAYFAGLTTLSGMSTTLLKNAAKPLNARAQATAEMVQGYR